MTMPWAILISACDVFPSTTRQQSGKGCHPVSVLQSLIFGCMDAVQEQKICCPLRNLQLAQNISYGGAIMGFNHPEFALLFVWNVLGEVTPEPNLNLHERLSSLTCIAKGRPHSLVSRFDAKIVFRGKRADHMGISAFDFSLSQ
jgi:hypothetical protein